MKTGDLPQEIRPLPLPIPETEGEGEDSGLAHLVGVAVDGEGIAYRLFTTNRWVTGERWHRAKDVIGLLDLFRVEHAGPPGRRTAGSPRCSTLFRPQIAMLVEERDRTLAAWAKGHRQVPATEDRRLEIVTSLRISIPEQCRAVDAALAERANVSL